MATFLDVTGLQYFTSLFVFIFAWALIYAVFMLTNLFKENKVIPALVAFIFSIFMVINPLIFELVKDISPWIGFLLVIIMILLPVIKVLIPGLEEGTMGARASFLMLIVFVVIVVALTRIRQEVKAPGDEGAGEVDYSKASNVLLHPKILGAVLLLLISVFTISLLVVKPG